MRSLSFEAVEEGIVLVKINGEKGDVSHWGYDTERGGEERNIYGTLQDTRQSE